MLKRKQWQARDGFEIKGITKEVCFTDLGRRDEKTRKWISFDAIDPESEDPYLAFEDDEESSPAPEPALPRLTPEVWKLLTPQQRRATELFMEDIPEREAAKRMGISQPYFHEIIHGKNGQGGVINKLRKHLSKNTLSVDY